MSTATEGLRRELQESLRTLVVAQGLALLENPLRLEGWLRDLHPDHRAAISVIMEGIHTQIYLESASVSDASAFLALRSGISPQWAEFSVRIWREVLKDQPILQRNTLLGTENTDHQTHHQTVEQVLGKYRSM